MNVNDTHLTELIENLNNLICENDLLTRCEREDLVRAVAAIGAVKARVSIQKPSSPKKRKEPAEKKEKIIDPRFPNAGTRWKEEDIELLMDALDCVPDEEIDSHVFWLAEKLGRTPFSAACKITTLRNLPEEWKDKYRKQSDKIRSSDMNISDYLASQTNQQANEVTY